MYSGSYGTLGTVCDEINIKQKLFRRAGLFSFQRNRSTEHSIVHALNYISNAMNENKYTIGVFFDLKKAFDVCSHDILLMKLSKMGITGMALNWFKSYLSHRTQVVDINGNIS